MCENLGSFQCVNFGSLECAGVGVGVVGGGGSGVTDTVLKAYKAMNHLLTTFLERVRHFEITYSARAQLQIT